jgi:hypothetical protein
MPASLRFLQRKSQKRTKVDPRLQSGRKPSRSADLPLRKQDVSGRHVPRSLIGGDHHAVLPQPFHEPAIAEVEWTWSMKLAQDDVDQGAYLPRMTFNRSAAEETGCYCRFG